MRRPLARRRRRRLRRRRARRRATRRPATSTRSTTIRRENFHITIHAGESFGLPSIWEALQFAAPSGSATASGSSTTSRSATTARSSSAGWRRSSATGACRSRCARPRTSTPAPSASIAEHPIDLLRRLRFRVTVNTDNRLMSGVSMSSRVRGARRGVRDRPRRDGVADDQRDEEGVRPVRRAAAADQRGREAGLRAPAGGRDAGRGGPGLIDGHGWATDRTLNGSGCWVRPIAPHDRNVEGSSAARPHADDPFIPGTKRRRNCPDTDVHVDG